MMLTILQKTVLFHGGCVPIRICLILLYYFYNSFEISSITFLIGVLFLYKAINGNSIGVFGSKVYWPRLFHSLTYVTSGVLMCIKNTQKYAFIPLLIDVVIGICPRITCFDFSIFASL